jgi:DNA-binding MarR family transcriptional regulator
MAKMTVTDERVPIPELASRLRWAVSRLHRRFRQLAPTDLTPTRLAALATVDRTGPLSMGQLARAERVAAPTMTRIVDCLERDGLVTRLADARDRRVARIQVSERGSRLLGGTRTKVDHYLADGLAGLDREQLERLAWAVALIEELADGAPAADAEP